MYLSTKNVMIIPYIPPSLMTRRPAAVFSVSAILEGPGGWVFLLGVVGFHRLQWWRWSTNDDLGNENDWKLLGNAWWFSMMIFIYFHGDEQKTMDFSGVSLSHVWNVRDGLILGLTQGLLGCWSRFQEMAQETTETTFPFSHIFPTH